MDPFKRNAPGPQALDVNNLQANYGAQWAARFGYSFKYGLAPDLVNEYQNNKLDSQDTSRPLSADEIRERYQESGIPVSATKLAAIQDGQFTENQLNRDIEDKRKRNSHQARYTSDHGFWGNAGLFLAGMLGDPLEFALTFFPVSKFGLVPRLGSLSTKAGGQLIHVGSEAGKALPSALRTGADYFIQGAVDSAADTAMIEMARPSSRSNSPANGYTMWDSINNIGFSVLIGAPTNSLKGLYGHFNTGGNLKSLPQVLGNKSTSEMVKPKSMLSQARALGQAVGINEKTQAVALEVADKVTSGFAQNKLAEVLAPPKAQGSSAETSPTAVGPLIMSNTQALQSALNEAPQKGQVGAALEVDYEQVADRAIEAAAHAPQRALDKFEKVAPETRVKVMNVAIIQAQMDKRIDVQAVLDSDPMIGIVMESDLRAAGGKSMVVQRGVLYDGACAQLLEIPLYRELPQVTSRIKQERMDLDDAKVFYVQTSKAQAVAPRSDEVKQTARPEVKPFVQGSYASGVTKTVPLGRSPLGPARNLKTILAQAAWRKPVLRLLDSSVLQVVDRVADLPNGPHNAKTKVLHLPDGRLYIAAENVSASELKAIMLREAGTRVGAKAMLGEQVYADVVQQFDDALVAGEAWAMEARANSLEAMEPSERYSAMLAYVVEHYPDLPLVQQMVSEMRGWFGEYLDGESEPLSDVEWGYLTASALHGGKREYVGGQE